MSHAAESARLAAARDHLAAGNELPERLDRYEAAALLDVSLSGLRLMIADGRVTPIPTLRRKGGNKAGKPMLFFLRASLEASLHANGTRWERARVRRL